MRIGIVCYPTFGGSGVLATELGKALAVATVRQDKLKKYRASQGADSMLESPDEVIYPVVVKNNPRAAIHVVKNGAASGATWKVSRFSDAPLMRAFDKATGGNRFEQARAEGTRHRGRSTLSLLPQPARRGRIRWRSLGTRLWEDLAPWADRRPSGPRPLGVSHASGLHSSNRLNRRPVSLPVRR